MANCLTPAGSRRRLFWATQPDACGNNEVCGYNCGVPGLSYTSSYLYDCNGGCQCCPPATIDPNCPEHAGVVSQTSIATTQWLRGLIINMLMTDGRKPDTRCGYRPGSQGGHWSSSYIETGPTDIGTLVRDLPNVGRIQESVNLVVAYAKATLDRLIERGVALSVEVDGLYLGGGKVQLNITVLGRTDGEAKVGISGARVQNGWVWQ